MIEAERDQGNRNRVAEPGEERIQVIGLKSHMSDDPRF
jgi:hypothetical protein